MSDENLGVEDPKPTGAEGAPEPQNQDSGKSLNSQAKDLPWVQDLMRKAAEHDRMVAEQKQAAAEAERKQLESQGEYEKALAAEQEKYNTTVAQHTTEVKLLKLDAAFAHAGLSDPRLVALFADGYDLETDVSEYVASVKADPKNAGYFQKTRTPLGGNPPPPNPDGDTEDFVPERDLESWRKSKNQKKRARAIAYSREKYERQLKGLTP